MAFFLILVVTASDAPALRAEEPTRLDLVEITGSRIGPEMPQVPGAVTAYDGAFLQANGIVGYGELAPLVPGFFVVAQSPENVSLNLRGLSSDSSDPRVAPRVSVFQDGVALADSHGNGVALFDQESVAVFKGPQPTRFGAGVQSGALALTSNRARDETSGGLTLGAGDFGARRAEAHVNSPVVPGELFARVAVYANQHDGYVDNLADGSDLQGENTVAVRASLRWQPATATTGDLIFNHQHDDTPGVGFKSASIPVSPFSTDTNPYTAANLTRGSELGVTRTISGLTGIVRHEFGDGWTLTSTSGWRQVESHNEFDADGSFLYLLELGEIFHGRQLSQELRLAYDQGERFTASTGVAAGWRKSDQTTVIRTDEAGLWEFLTGLPSSLLPAVNHRYSEHNINEAEAASGDLFGRVDYRLADRLTVGGGLRGTQERLVSRYQSFAAATPGNVALLPTSGGGNDIFRVSNGELENSAEVRSWGGQLDVRYALTPRLTSFAAVSRGRSPRVLDFDQITLAPLQHAEETVWNHEVGVKGASSGKRFRYDASVFQYDFEHFQTQRVIAPGVRQAFDGGRARGRGFEASLQGEVTPGFTVFGTYGYTDARFASLGEDGQPQAYAGNTFRITSLNTFSLGGTLSLPAADRGMVFFTPLYLYRSAYYFEDDNARYGGTLRQGGFGRVNLRSGYRPHSLRWEIAGYVNNVFDKEYLLDSGNTGGAYGIPTNVAAAPRTVGVEATVRF